MPTGPSKIDITTLAKKLKSSSFIPSLRRGPTGIGFTLETRLGIRENNKDDYDFIDTGLYFGIPFELKAQRRIILDPSKPKGWRNNTSPISLVTQSPHEGMSNRDLIEKYGYIDLQSNRKNLYTTLKCNKYTNGEKIKDMKLSIEGNCLYIIHKKTKLSHYNLTLFGKKLENLIVFRARSKSESCECKDIRFYDKGKKSHDHEYFHFDEITVLSKFKMNKFYELLDNGKIKLDIRMHIRYDKNITGGYFKDHDHGTALRISFRYLPEIYEKCDLI